MLKFTRDSFVQNLSQGKLLVPYLERFDEWDEPWEFRHTPKVGDDAWHPSGDCLASPAELYAKAKGEEREAIGASLQRSFMVGHFWHQLLQHVLVAKLGFAEPRAIERRGWRGWNGSGEELDVHRDAATGNVIWGSDPRQGGYPIHQFAPYHWATGQGDLVPLCLPSGWEGIGDIKTMRSGDFKAASASGLLPDRFADKYEAQINIYMDFFDQEHGLILGVNKDSPHDFVEFIFDRNQPLIDAIYDKWQYVSECLDRGSAPEDKPESGLPFQGPTG